MTSGIATRDAARRRWLPRAGQATPDRLRRVGAVIVAGCIVTASVGVLSGVERAAAVRDAGTRIAALTADAAALYQSLADADAMATTGYVSGGREPAAVRTRYDEDIARAADRLVHAAGRLPEGDPATAPLAAITTQLPVYTGLIDTARTYNRQGLPLGQSYLNSGSRLMRSSILPAAVELRERATTALATAYARGAAFPFAVLLLGLALLAAVIDLAVRERARTNRVLSPGLVAAAVAIVVAMVWWAGAALLAGNALAAAGRHSDAASALDDARTAVLQARSNESLVLVARSGGSADQSFTEQLERVVGPQGADGPLLAQAAGKGVDVEGVRSAALAWREAHSRVRELDDGGRYQEAVASVVGPDPGGSGALFQRVDDTLARVVALERDAFARDVQRAAAAQVLLAVGPALLVLLASGGVAMAVGRRVGEYR